MKANNEFLALLRCPRCGHGLSIEKTLACKKCKVEFPVTGDVPWLFETPQATMTHWKNRFLYLVSQLNKQASELSVIAKKADFALTRRRLEIKAGAKKEQGVLLKKLLPFFDLNSPQDPTFYQSFATKIPLSQDLMSYEANIHRDWAWGENENKESLACIQAVLPKQALKTVLFLGAGAGRLAYDIHRAFRPQLSIALDFNPLLLTLAHRLFHGESLNLYDFPIAPLTSDSIAVLNTLKAPEICSEGFHFLLADGTQPPFDPKTFDLIVTPWFIDIIPLNFLALTRRINSLLKPGGRWVNFGSYNFRNSEESIRFSHEEVLALSQDNGFILEHKHSKRIPYLDCPYSCHSRIENVLTFSMRKEKDSPPPEVTNYLPDWIRLPYKKIPAAKPLQDHAMIFRIQSEVLVLANGERSLKDIAEIVFKGSQFTTEETVDVVRNIFITVFEAGLFKNE